MVPSLRHIPLPAIVLFFGACASAPPVAPTESPAATSPMGVQEKAPEGCSCAKHTAGSAASPDARQASGTATVEANEAPGPSCGCPHCAKVARGEPAEGVACTCGQGAR
jgi:hypothetical protein